MLNFVVFFFCWFTSLLYILLLINLCCVFLKLHKQCVCFCLVLFIFLTWQIFTRFQFNAKLTHSLVLANFKNEHKNFDCNTQNKIQKFRILIIYFFLLLFLSEGNFSFKSLLMCDCMYCEWITELTRIDITNTMSRMFASENWEKNITYTYIHSHTHT